MSDMTLGLNDLVLQTGFWRGARTKHEFLVQGHHLVLIPKRRTKFLLEKRKQHLTNRRKAKFQRKYMEGKVKLGMVRKEKHAGIIHLVRVGEAMARHKTTRKKLLKYQPCKRSRFSSQNMKIKGGRRVNGCCFVLDGIQKWEIQIKKKLSRMGNKQAERYLTCVEVLFRKIGGKFWKRNTLVLTVFMFCLLKKMILAEASKIKMIKHRCTTLMPISENEIMDSVSGLIISKSDVTYAMRGYDELLCLGWGSSDVIHGKLRPEVVRSRVIGEDEKLMYSTLAGDYIRKLAAVCAGMMAEAMRKVARKDVIPDDSCWIDLAQRRFGFDQHNMTASLNEKIRKHQDVYKNTSSLPSAYIQGRFQSPRPPESVCSHVSHGCSVFLDSRFLTITATATEFQGMRVDEVLSGWLLVMIQHKREQRSAYIFCKDGGIAYSGDRTASLIILRAPSAECSYDLEDKVSFNGAGIDTKAYISEMQMG